MKCISTYSIEYTIPRCILADVNVTVAVWVSTNPRSPCARLGTPENFYSNHTEKKSLDQSNFLNLIPLQLTFFMRFSIDLIWIDL